MMLLKLAGGEVYELQGWEPPAQKPESHAAKNHPERAPRTAKSQAKGSKTSEPSR